MQEHIIMMQIATYSLVQAAEYLSTGTNNVCIGLSSGRWLTSNSGNVFIGNQAGSAEYGSNKLYIANSATTTPLIWGDFANSAVRINGSLYSSASDGNSLTCLSSNDSYHTSITIGRTVVEGRLAISAGNSQWLSNTVAGDLIIRAEAITKKIHLGVDPLGAPVLTVMNNRIGIGTTSPGYMLEVAGSAAKPGGGSWTSTSDSRLKNIHGNYTSGIKEIMKLKPVLFNYIDRNPRNLPSNEEYIGFVAQDVQSVFPEAVTTGSDGYLDFNMHPVNVAMVNAIQQQQMEIESVKSENQQLKSELKELKEKMEKIDAMLVKDK
jgi:hypothetical protein